MSEALGGCHYVFQSLGQQRRGPSRRHPRRAETDSAGTPLDGSGGCTRASPEPSRVPRARRGSRALRGGSRDWTRPRRTAHRGSAGRGDERTFRLLDLEEAGSFSSTRSERKRKSTATAPSPPSPQRKRKQTRIEYRIVSFTYHSYVSVYVWSTIFREPHVDNSREGRLGPRRNLFRRAFRVHSGCAKRTG